MSRRSLRPDEILFYGDPHGVFDPLVQTALTHQSKAVVLLGDMDATRPLDEELDSLRKAGIAIYFIPGNHDSDSETMHDHVFGSALAENNLHARVVDIAGLRIAGLGGIFRGQVWHPNTDEPMRYESRAQHCQKLEPERSSQARNDRRRWRGGVPLRHRTTIYPEDVRRLRNRRADILVTHEAPSCMVAANGRRMGFPEIDRLARAMGVKTVIHGHHHHHYEAEIDGGIRVIGVGRSGVIDLDGTILVPGRGREPKAPETA